jgi:diketogulonate reductase-like aldo/keto reductase
VRIVSNAAIFDFALSAADMIALDGLNTNESTYLKFKTVA